MKRINLYIPEQHHTWLTEKSDELGISSAEIIRRALDFWIKAKSSAADGVVKSLDPEYDPFAVYGTGKPFGVELRERLDRIEYVVLASLSPEAQARLLAENERRARELGFAPAVESEDTEQ